MGEYDGISGDAEEFQGRHGKLKNKKNAEGWIDATHATHYKSRER